MQSSMSHTFPGTASVVEKPVPVEEATFRTDTRPVRALQIDQSGAAIYLHCLRESGPIWAFPQRERQLGRRFCVSSNESRGVKMIEQIPTVLRWNDGDAL